LTASRWRVGKRPQKNREARAAPEFFPDVSINALIGVQERRFRQNCSSTTAAYPAATAAIHLPIFDGGASESAPTGPSQAAIDEAVCRLSGHSGQRRPRPVATQATSRARIAARNETQRLVEVEAGGTL